MECTLRGIFQQRFESYAQRRGLPLYVHRAAYWISRCRTADLGGHVRRCPAGHVERAFYNSCQQRGCPQCQAMATEAWLERQRARLLACAHHHLIFTIPHVHVLAADGGLDDNGAWVKPRRSHFLPARVLMLLFRGKLLAALRERIAGLQLRLPPGLSRERAFSLLNRLGRKKWNVHIRARYAHGEGVAAYLARYLKGGPLKNTQIVAVQATRVCFRYTPHRDGDDAGTETVLMSLSPQAFLERYLAHIAPPRLQTVRGYGLYGPRQRAALDQARSALGQPPVQDTDALDAPQFLARFEQVPPTARCPRCKSILLFRSALPRGTGPPQTRH